MTSPPKRRKRPPFVFAYKAIIRNPKLSSDARLLMLLIKSYGNSDGLYCYPAQDTLAANMGCSERSIQRLIAELKKAGLVSVVQSVKKDGEKSTNTYLVDDEPRARMMLPKRQKRGDSPVVRQTTPVAGGEASKIVRFTEEKYAAS